MKTSQDYFNKKSSRLFDALGVFFAFSPKQFYEKRVEGRTYVDMGGGMICPKDNAKALNARLDEIIDESIVFEKKHNSKEAIIKRELANYECYYTGDISDCVDALGGHGYTREEIWKIFYEELPKQEL